MTLTIDDRADALMGSLQESTAHSAAESEIDAEATFKRDRMLMLSACSQRGQAVLACVDPPGQTVSLLLRG
jgi:hypothetical protein